MPQVAAGAAIGAGISTGFAMSTAAGGLAIAAAGGTAAFFAQQFAISFALGAVSQALNKQPRAEIGQVGRNSFVKQPITNRTAVYGRVRQSGPLVYVESTNDDEYLHLVIALAAHEVEEIETIIVNDQELTLDGSGNCTAPSQYAGLIRINKHNGEADQAADADLVAESNGLWTNAHRLRGVAYIYARLKFDQDAFPSGIPSISAIVKGKKLFDPRSSTTVYSANAALVLRDYLTDTNYGLGADATEIDDDAFISAANICDEDVTLAAGGTENRYEAHGVIDSGATPRSNIEALLTACGGTLYYTGGKWTVKVAAYSAPVMTLTNDDLRGSVEIQTRQSRRDNFNGVKGIFISPDGNWQPTDYPAVTSETFVTVDGGDENLLDLELPFTTSSSMAQRLAKIVLYKQRQQLVVNLKCSLKPFTLTVGDTIQFTSDRFGWSGKIFEVINWTFSSDPADMGVNVTLQETSSTVYDWDAEETAFEQDNTNLPNPFVVAPPGVALSDTLRAFNQEAVTFLVANISASNLFASEFEVEARKQGETEWINLGRASGNRFELANVEDDAVYEVRARTITSIGTKSAYTTATHSVVGKAAPPSDVTNFKVNITGTEAHLSWTAVSDLDLSHYRIRHSAVTSGATYSNAQDLATRVSRPATSVVVPAKTGTYFIKAVDKLGNSSTNATASVAIINSVNGGNVVQTITESPTFPGTKTNCEVISSALLITSGNTSGTYVFDGDIDLGAKYQCRLTNSITVQRFDRSNLFDSAGGLFDSRAGQFDGVGDFDDIDTEIQVRHTDDDPSGAPTWSDWRQFDVGEYAARAFQFRLLLSGDSTNVSPQVTALSVTIDMPDRVIADSDIASGAGAKSVTFSPAFKSLQGIGIAAQNLVSGDYYTITSKSVSGFTITFYDSGDNAVDRTFDYVARGYGEVI